MDWITQKYVAAEAKKGDRQALECTRLHWQQLVKAKPKELKKALDENKVTVRSYYCAMCLRYESDCSQCFLICKLWPEAFRTIKRWVLNPTRYYWRKWRKAAKAMLADIDAVYERFSQENNNK